MPARTTGEVKKIQIFCNVENIGYRNVPVIDPSLVGRQLVMFYDPLPAGFRCSAVGLGVSVW